MFERRGVGVCVTERQKLGAKLDPALREWADRVIIPALAREVFAQREFKKIAVGPTTVPEFQRNSRPSAKETL
jgi:hypothetical protein